jgi:5-dehydro-2-deoxygluconokinase
VDVSALGTHPTLRTALAFEEDEGAGAPAMAHYREPTCPDWELRSDDMPVGAIRGAPIAYVTGTGLAREPSRTTTLLALEPRARRPVSGNRWTIFDLDWHEPDWRTGGAFPMLARAVAGAAEVVLGDENEWRAADLRPLEALGLGVRLVIVRHSAGATVYDRHGERRVPGLAPEGATGGPTAEAFAAALGAALLAGVAPHEAVRRGLASGAAVAGRRRGSAGMPTAGEIDASLEDGAAEEATRAASQAPRAEESEPPPAG